MENRRTVISVKSHSTKSISSIALKLYQDHFKEYTKNGYIKITDFIDIKMPDIFKYHLNIVQTLPDGVEAYTDFEQKTVTFTEETWRSAESGEARSRFSAAHELGHVVLHAIQLQNTIKAKRLMRGNLPSYQDPEWQANCFAGSLLMPKVNFYSIPKYPTKELCKQFGVSYKALEIRIETFRNYGC